MLYAHYAQPIKNRMPLHFDFHKIAPVLLLSSIASTKIVRNRTICYSNEQQQQQQQ